MFLRACLCLSVVLAITSPALPQENSSPGTANSCVQAVTAEEQRIEKRLQDEKAEIEKVAKEEKQELNSIKIKANIDEALAGLASILSGIAAFRDTLRSLFGRKKASRASA